MSSYFPKDVEMVAAFFPWLRLEREVVTDVFTVMPYGRNRGGQDSPFDRAFRHVLAQFASYSRAGETPAPLDEVSLLLLPGVAPGVPFSDRQIEEFGEIVELVAFAGLASRQFHEPARHHYCSYSQFQFVIQSFKREPGATWTTHRKRDGGSNTLVSAGSVQVKPLEVSTSSVSLNIELLDALLKTRATSKEWPRVFEAIVQFNAANSDTNQVPQFLEVITSLSCVGRCLGLSHKDKEDDWIGSFVERHKPRIPEVPATRFFKNAKSADYVAAHWLRQFYRVRNKYAHGGIDDMTNDWDTSNHLLIAATVAPLLVKTWLQELVGYVLTDDDLSATDALERRMLSVRRGAQPLPSGRDHPWFTADFDAACERAARRFVELAGLGAEVQ